MRLVYGFNRDTDIYNFTFRDIGYYNLLPGIWDTVFNILVTFRDIEY